MFDKLKLLRGLRKIWFGFTVVTPQMVVDTCKLFYTFITGRAPCLCLLVLSLCCVSANAGTSPRYRLSKPRVTKTYRLAPQPRVQAKAKQSTATKATSLVVVSATWCQPCKRLYPVIERLAASGYNAKVVYEVPENANVSAYPTLLFYRDGKLVETLVGVQTEAAIKRRLTK